jgi:hypothetical protein
MFSTIGSVRVSSLGIGLGLMGFVLQLEKALGFMLLAGQTLLTEDR